MVPLFVRFSNGTARYVFEDGVEKTYFADGSVQTVDINRVKTITHANGESVSDLIKVVKITDILMILWKT